MDRLKGRERELVREGAPAPEQATSAAERDAVARCLAGDRDAYQLLVELHQRRVYAAASRILSHREDVEDAVQEAFILGFRNLRSYRGESSFGTWIYKIAINVALRKASHLRKQAWLPLAEDRDRDPCAAANQEGSLDATAKEQRREAVRQAVSRLPEKHRAVVALRYLDGYSCSEVARILGCSLGTVWSRLHYALKALKEELGDLQDDT